MLEHCRKERFLYEKFSLSVLDVPHGHSCIQKIATSVQSGTRWLLQPTQMALVSAAESGVLTEYESIKL